MSKIFVENIYQTEKISEIVFGSSKANIKYKTNK